MQRQRFVLLLTAGLLPVLNMGRNAIGVVVEPTIYIQDSITTSTGGSFDVVLEGGGINTHIAGFTVEPHVDPASGVTFTQVDANTTSAPYIFGTDQLPPFTFTTLPSNDLIASGADFAPPYYVETDYPDTFGLAHVTYTSTGTLPASVVTVTLADVGGGTSLSDENGVAPDFAPLPGTITFVTPEPTTLALVALAMPALLCRRRRTEMN